MTLDQLWWTKIIIKTKYLKKSPEMAQRTEKLN